MESRWRETAVTADGGPIQLNVSNPKVGESETTSSVSIRKSGRGSEAIE